MISPLAVKGLTFEEPGLPHENGCCLKVGHEYKCVDEIKKTLMS